MKTKTLFSCAVILLMIVSQSFAQFNKSKDILIAQFDSKPDPDDIHAIAALGCILAHNDFRNINYYAVAGAYGWQGGRYIDAPGLFNMAFGAKNTNWTDAYRERNNSVTRIKNKVKPILQAGGKVYVQEAGQSDITRDWCQALRNDGISASVLKNNVVVVQHSQWNIDKTTQSDLNWVKSNTKWTKIGDGNGTGNGTPSYRSTNKSFIGQAKNSQNGKARDLWREADRVIQQHGHFPGHSSISVGGVDFSDCVENWWIFGLGGSADNISRFWSRFVTNNNNSGGNPGGQYVQLRKRNASNFAIDGNVGGKDGQNVYLYSQSSGNVNQQWEEISRGNGYYTYKKRNTNFCLDGGSGGANGQNVYLWTCNSGNQNQHWKKVSMGSNNYRLEKRNAPGFSIDGNVGGANGQNLYLWASSNSNQNQHWSFNTLSNARNSQEIASAGYDNLSQIEVFPNPALGMVTIHTKEMKFKAVGIMNALGRVVYQEALLNESNSHQVNLATLASGVYFVELKNDTNSYTVRIVKE